MSGVGPVEPADPTEANPDGDTTAAHRGEPGHDIIGADSPRLSDRWRALPPLRRRAALTAAAATVAATLVWLLPAPPSTTPPEQPPSTWPAAVTAFRYVGVDVDRQTGASGDFRFDVSVQDGPPVTVSGITAAPSGLHTRTTPRTSFTVRAGTTRRITVRISVSECSGLPRNVALPFLDVTLRNIYAIQHYSFIFGGQYSRDLSALLHTACDTAWARPSSTYNRKCEFSKCGPQGIPAKTAESDLHRSSPTSTS